LKKKQGFLLNFIKNDVNWPQIELRLNITIKGQVSISI
jgi:hypothetical protein